MRRSLFRLVLVVAASAPLVVASTAHAETDAERVEALKKQGNQAMVELNYAEALDVYRRALRLDPEDASLHYNLGRALQARAEFPEALDAFEAFRRKASPELRARVPKLEELLADVRARVGSLTVTCTQDLPTAKVVLVVDGATVEAPGGCAPAPRALRVSLPKKSGVVEARLEHETHQAQPVRVTLTGAAAPVAVELVTLARATSGLLRVHTVPEGALVAVDGASRGNAPLELPVSVGPHTLDVYAPNHDASRVPIVVEAGKDKNVDVKLVRSTPITQRWWFWTGAAVIVAGAAVTTYILVAQPERAAGEGTIPPGQIAAPLVRF